MTELHSKYREYNSILKINSKYRVTSLIEIILVCALELKPTEGWNLYQNSFIYIKVKNRDYVFLTLHRHVCRESHPYLPAGIQ